MPPAEVWRAGGLSYLRRGDPAAPAVVCLHGFPDSPRSFEPLLTILAERGFCAVAPWMRGYAPSTLAGPYHPLQLAADVVELCGAVFPQRRVSLVGHDWGAVAVYAALRRPELFHRAVTLAVPHPQAFVSNLPRHPWQLRRSWYMLLFQVPGLAERALGARDFALVDRLWRDWSPGYRPGAGFMSELKACLRASMPAPIEYYRAVAWPPLLAARRGREAGLLGGHITTPTLYLHGAEDGCIGPGLAAGQERCFRGPFRAELIAGAGHFLHLERPEAVGARIVDWLGPA